MASKGPACYVLIWVPELAQGGCPTLLERTLWTPLAYLPSAHDICCSKRLPMNLSMCLGSLMLPACACDLLARQDGDHFARRQLCQLWMHVERLGLAGPVSTDLSRGDQPAEMKYELATVVVNRAYAQGFCLAGCQGVRNSPLSGSLWRGHTFALGIRGRTCLLELFGPNV